MKTRETCKLQKEDQHTSKDERNYASYFKGPSSVQRMQCYCHVLVIVNSAVMITGVHVSFQTRVFLFSRYMPGV